MVSPAFQGFGLSHARNIINSGRWFWNNVGAPTAGFIGQQSDRFKDSHTERNNEALEPTGYNMDSIRDSANRNEPLNFKTDPIELYKRYQEQYMNPEKWDSLFGNTIQVDNIPAAQIYDYPSSWGNSSDPKKVKAWLLNEKLKEEVQEKELQVLEEVPAIGKDSYQSRIYGTQNLTAITDSIGEVDSKRFLENFDNTTEDITGLNFKDRDHAAYWSLDNWKDIGYNLVSGGFKLGEALAPGTQGRAFATESFKALLEDSARNKGKTTGEAYASGLIAPPDSPTRNPLNNPVVDFVKTVGTNTAQKQIKNILEGGTQLFESTVQATRPYQARLYMDRLLPEAVKGTPIGQTATQILEAGASSIMPGLGALNALSLMQENKVQIYYDAIVRDQKSKGTYKKGWIAEDNRLDQAAQMAIDNGDIPWAKQLAAEVITDPIELIPVIGMYGGLTRGAIRGGMVGAKALKPRPIAFDALKNELRLPKMNTLGLSKPNISFKSLLDTDISINLDFKRMFPTLKNIFTRNPTVDKNLISESRVNLQNVLENDIGITHEESDSLVNLMSNIALDKGINPTKVFEPIQYKGFNFKPSGETNNLYLPEEYRLFKREPREILEATGYPIFKTGLEDAVNLLDEITTINRLKIPVDSNGIKTFNIKEGGINLINPENGLLTAKGTSRSQEFQAIGLKVNDELVNNSHIKQRLEDLLNAGQRTININDLKQLIKNSKVVVVSQRMSDEYGWTNLNRGHEQSDGSAYVQWITHASTPGPKRNTFVETYLYNSPFLEEQTFLAYDPNTNKMIPTKPTFMSDHYNVSVEDERIINIDPDKLLGDEFDPQWQSGILNEQTIHGSVRYEDTYLITPDGNYIDTHNIAEMQFDYAKALDKTGKFNKINRLLGYLSIGDEAKSFIHSNELRKVYYRKADDYFYKHINELGSAWAAKINPDTLTTRSGYKYKKILEKTKGYAGKFKVTDLNREQVPKQRNKYWNKNRPWKGIKRTWSKGEVKGALDFTYHTIAINPLDQTANNFIDLKYEELVSVLDRIGTRTDFIKRKNSGFRYGKTRTEKRNLAQGNEIIYGISPEQFLNLAFKDASIIGQTGSKVPASNPNSLNEVNKIFDFIKRLPTHRTNKLLKNASQLRGEGISETGAYFEELIYIRVHNIKRKLEGTKSANQNRIEIDIGMSPKLRSFTEDISAFIDPDEVGYGRQTKAWLVDKINYQSFLQNHFQKISNPVNNIVSKDQQLMDFFPRGELKPGDNVTLRDLITKFEISLREEIFTEMLGHTFSQGKSGNDINITSKFTKTLDDPSGINLDPENVLFTRQQIEDGSAGIKIRQVNKGELEDKWIVQTPDGFTDPAFIAKDSKDEIIDDVLEELNKYRSGREPKILAYSPFVDQNFEHAAKHQLQLAALEDKSFVSISGREEIKARWNKKAPYDYYSFLDGRKRKDVGLIPKAFINSINETLKSFGFILEPRKIIRDGKQVILKPKNTSAKNTLVKKGKLATIKAEEGWLDEVDGEFATADEIDEYMFNIKDREGNTKESVFNITGSERLIKNLEEIIYDKDDTIRSIFDDAEEIELLASGRTHTFDDFVKHINTSIKAGMFSKHKPDPKTIELLEITKNYLDWLTPESVGKMAKSKPMNTNFNLLEAINHYNVPQRFRDDYSDETIINFIAKQAGIFMDSHNILDDAIGNDLLKVEPRHITGSPSVDVTTIDLKANLLDIFDKPIDLNGKELELRNKRYISLGDVLRETEMRLNKISPENNTNGNIVGYTDFKNDGATIIRILRSGDFNTSVHEHGHLIRRTLLNEQELETVGRAIMGDNNWDALPNKNVWTVEAEEMFANQLETYIRTGQAKKGLARYFDKIINYLKTFYRSIRNTTVEKELNPELKKFFDEFIDIGRPTKEKIISSLPTHEQSDALKFFGYDGGTIPTPVLPSTIKGVALHDQPRYAEQQAETILFKTEQDDFTVAKNNIKSQQQAINELPWDEYKKWEAENLDETEVGLEILPDTKSMEEIVSSNFIMDSWEVLAQTPGIRETARLFNPSAGARNPLFKSIIALRRMQEQATSLTTNAMARLDRLGSSQKVFGSFDDTGRISEGPLQGFNVNDIRSRPLDPRWRNLLTDAQRVWIRTAESLERAKLAMLKAEGIDIRTLPEAEGGGTVYAGRRTFAQIADDGEVLDLINMGVGSRPGAKAAFEKARKFETMEEAIENGYRYIPDEEALKINIEAAYNRVAYQRHMQYISDNVITIRTAAAPERVKIARDVDAQRLKQGKALLRQLFQTRRGENIHQSTLRSLKNSFPELAGRIDEISKLTLDHVIKAGVKAGQQPISMRPDKEYFTKLMSYVLRLETQVKALKEQGLEVPVDLATELDKAQKKFNFAKFVKGKAYENFKAGKGYQYTWWRSAQSILLEPRVGLIDELIDVVGGVREPGTRRRRGGLIQDLHKKAAESQAAFTRASQEASQLQRGEGIFRDAPAYSGRIFTRNQPDTLGGMSGQDVSNMLNREIISKNQGYEGGFANVLKATRVFNAATRFFTLGADASVFYIHLAFMWGESVSNPALMGNIAKGFVASIFSPTYHAKLIDDNSKLLAKYPDVIVGTGARFETTEYFNLIKRAGFNKYKPFRVARKAIEAPYVPAQRAFESALDSAAIQLLKAFDHLGVDEKSIRELSDYVNEVRGLASGKRLGVSSKQRDWERQALLAPSYNRAIAALMSDLIKPSLNMRNFTPGLAANADLRVQLARRSFSRGMAALAFIIIAANIAQDMDMEDIVNQRLNPNSPGFLGVNIGGNEIGFGGKARSIIQLWTRMGVAAYEGNSEEFIPQSMTELGAPLRFVRGNLSFGAQSATTILSGRTYMGDRIYKEGIWDSAKAFGAHVFPGPFTGPIWVQSALFEGGSLTDRGTRAIAEAFGGRGYPEGSYQILREFTKNNLDMDYEDLEPFERRIVRKLLEPQLTPIQMERIEQGDNTAGYWAAIEDLDAIRLAQEESILMKYQQRTGKYAQGGLNALRQDFYAIQENFAQQKELLNQQFDMFQDDVEFDEDNPAKFVLSEWYGLYEKASDPQTGLLNYDKLNALQGKFWQQELPDGTLYNNYFGYIRRNTSSTTHPAEFARILSQDTVLNINLAAQARIDFLNSKPAWSQAFDKYEYTLEDFSIWK